MHRHQLEHVLRASGSISGCRELIVLGSQALLGPVPNPPPELVKSMEVDLYPLTDPGKADMIDGCIGELSPFHETFGYYAHGVGPETAILPRQWKSRLVRVETDQTGGVVGWCLSPVDLAISKLIAGREKDVAFVRDLLKADIVSATRIQEATSELDEDATRRVTAALRTLA